MLGPLLFLLFINNLPLHLEKDTEFYADDTTLHAADKSLEVIETKIQNSATPFDIWCVEFNVLKQSSHEQCFFGNEYLSQKL